MVCSTAVRLHTTYMIHPKFTHTFFYYNHQTSTVGNRREKGAQQRSGKHMEHGGREALDTKLLGRPDLCLLKKQTEHVSEKEGKGWEIVFGA